MGKKKNRQTELDLLRLIAMMGVIVMHIKLSGTVPHTQFGSTMYHGIWASVTWCVPVFVMISGRFFLIRPAVFPLVKYGKSSFPES